MRPLGRAGPAAAQQSPEAGPPFLAGQPLPGYIGCIPSRPGRGWANPSALKKELAALKAPEVNPFNQLEW